MSKPALDFRTKFKTLSKAQQAAEWKRLGVKPPKADPDNDNSFEPLKEVIKGYMEGSGINALSSPQKKPNKKWIQPTEPSALHKAYLEHADEIIASLPLDGARPDPFMCYLIKEGWVSPVGWSVGDQSLVDVGDQIWRLACHKAMATQEAEGVFLNPRGLQILQQSLTSFEVLTNRNYTPDSQYVDFKVIRTTDEKNFPIGPGFENFLARFRKWVPSKSVEEIRMLTSGNWSALSPWILEVSQLASTVKGLGILLPLAQDGDDIDYLGSDQFGIKRLLANKHLGKQGQDLLVEWALGQALEFQSENDKLVTIRGIFLDMAKRQEQLSSMQRARVILSLGDRLDPKVKTGTREYDDDDDDDEPDMDEDDFESFWAFATIPWVSQEPEIRDKLLARGGETIRLEMMHHATGLVWIDLVQKLSKADDIEELDFVRALKYADAKNLVGLKRSDLAPLLGSSDKTIRTEGIRLAGLMPSRTQQAR